MTVLFVLYFTSHLTSSQISYSPNPYSTYFGSSPTQYVSPFGPYNFENPTNQQRRIYIPGIGMFRPVNSLNPFPYFRNDQSINTTTMPSINKYWSQEGPIKYTIFPSPSGGLNVGLVDENQESSQLYLSEEAWNQIPVYLKYEKSQNLAAELIPPPINTAKTIPKSFYNTGRVDSTIYPYTRGNMNLFNSESQGTDSELKLLNSTNNHQTNSKPEASSSILLTNLQKNKSEENPLTGKCGEVLGPVLYYYKDPCPSYSPSDTFNPPPLPVRTQHVLDTVNSPINVPLLANTKNFEFEANDSQPISNEIKTSIHTNSDNKDNNRNLNSFELLNSLHNKPNTKPEVINTQGSIQTRKETNHAIYNPYIYHNLKSESDANFELASNANIDSLSRDSVAAPLSPTYYHYTDQNYNPAGATNLKLPSNILQTTSPYNDYLENINLGRRISNPLRSCYKENLQNMNSAKEMVNLPSVESVLSFSKEKKSGLKSEIKHPDSVSVYGDENIYQSINRQRGTYMPPVFATSGYNSYANAGGGYGANRYGSYNYNSGSYNNKIPLMGNVYGYGANPYGRGYKMYPAGNQYYGKGNQIGYGGIRTSRPYI